MVSKAENTSASFHPIDAEQVEIDLNEPKADSQEVLEKFDRESRLRHIQWRPAALVVSGVAIALSIYHMYTSYFGTPPVLQHRAIHVGAILILAFALYPPIRKARRDRIPVYDLVLIGLALATALYVVLNYVDIVHRAGTPTTTDMVFGGILCVLIIEAARRLTGFALPTLAILFMLYALYGRNIPGMFRHRGYELGDMLNFLYLTTEGIYGTAIAVSASYIFLFVLFGAVLQKSGMGQFFNDFALALAGQTRGGPAKVAVIASGFLGSINGAAVANVVTTGAFTIPLMKRVGYRSVFAGAVEATASVGGQILPPIMGASAFIMAETLGLPYREIALAAIIPALLYYLGIIAQVHLRATRRGLKGISRENLPAVKAVLAERGHLLIPLFFLIYMLFFSGRTILFSALLTILLTVIIAELRPATRMTPKDIVESLELGAKTAVSVAVACAAVGIIVGVVTLTGFGVKLAHAIVAFGAGNLLFSLFLTMIASIILGMGLPSIPTYIITATMAAPALAELGVEPLVAHMFVFYFGLFANITPPVALASFAAAGLSGADPMRTGLQSMRLALAGYIIPYMFVLNPAMLMQGASLTEAVSVSLTAIFGVLLLAVAVEGHLMVEVPWYIRVIFFIGALTMMSPNTTTDLIGVVIATVAIVFQAGLAKKQDSLSVRAI
ncbi:MAG: TRAP transporter permease [Actinomycetaceae bacterium]|nr:TRAP transporter permease [Actinomycetaceae bacterium]